MAKLDADMQSLVRRTILCFAATINGDGSPNLSPKSTLIVHDDDHLLFSNIASPRTVANLRLDPRIEINCVDIFSRRGYRFTGHASVRSAGDCCYETPDAHHAVSRNASATEPAKLLAVFVVDTDDKALTTPDK